METSMTEDTQTPQYLRTLSEIRWDGKEALLTVSEAAEALKVSTKTLRDWINQGYIPVEKVGPKRARWRLIPAVVRAMAERRRMEGLK